MKTVRFAQVVAHSGKPHSHAFWVTPAKDREFLAAQKAERVMTVAPPAPGKADVGTIGFEATSAKSGQVLIFPKSLRAFAGARVVGIKFDQLEQPPLVAADAEVRERPARAKSASAATSPPRRADPQNIHDARRERDRQIRHPRRGESVHAGWRAPNRSSPPPVARSRESNLRREVKAALSELEGGKTVAAYERLQRAMGDDT